MLPSQVLIWLGMAKQCKHLCDCTTPAGADVVPVVTQNETGSLVSGFLHQSKGYMLYLRIVQYKRNTKNPLSAKFFVWRPNNMLRKFFLSCL